MRRRRRLFSTLMASGSLTLLASCISGTTDGQLLTFSGEWCTLRGLAPSGFPAPGVSYVGMVSFQESGQLSGTGSTSYPDSETIYPARFSGTVVGRDASISVSDLTPGETPGPQFTMELRLEGERDLIGTMTGEPGFEGPIHLVRLGPRCFVQ